ncbi:hypothetical protein QEN19_004017 [Hanseniaspora menglaensis]
MSDFELFEATDGTIRHDHHIASRDSLEHYKEDNLLGNESLNILENDVETESLDFNGEVLYKGSLIRLYPQDPRTSLIQKQVAVCLLMFTTLGLNDQTTGMFIPLLTSYYSISTVMVSNIFLVQTIGYSCSCFVSEPLHSKFGVRGALVFSCLCIALPSFLLYTKVAWFGFYLACYFPIGIGIGLLDSIVNCVFSSFTCYKNQLLGAAHGMYGVCSFITPILINAIGEKNWNNFFILQFGIAALGTFFSFYFFRYETKEKYEYLIQRENQKENIEDGETSTSDMSTLELMKKNPVIWLYAAALFFYLGSEVGTGSWIFTYLTEYKGGSKAFMAYITSAYWLGLTVGRFYFGLMIDKWFANEYAAVKFFSKTTMICTLMMVVLGALFSKSSVYFSAFGAVVFACGLFIGPIFPLLAIVGFDMMDANIKVKGVSTSISLGSIGAAFLPYTDGILMKHLGFANFPVLISITTACCVFAVYAYPWFIKNKTAYFSSQ